MEVQCIQGKMDEETCAEEEEKGPIRDGQRSPRTEFG